MKQSKKSRSDNGESRHTWAYYDLQTKLEYKQAMNGRSVHIRPAQYTSKTSSVNGVIGNRNGHWFKCSSGAILNADFNAGRNLALWDYRTTPINFEKAVGVMPVVNLSEGVFGSPLNSMNIVNGRAVQLSLFDTTAYDARRENPTTLGRVVVWSVNTYESSNFLVGISVLQGRRGSKTYKLQLIKRPKKKLTIFAPYGESHQATGKDPTGAERLKSDSSS